MNVLNFDSKQCERIRRHLDAYLSSELLVETTSDVLRHLESCEACSRELETRTRVRDALRRAAVSQIPPEELRQSIQRRLRKTPLALLGGSPRLTWAVALAGIVVVALGGIATLQWIRVLRGRRVVASVLALGVSDHLQCAIKGHNYPDIANPPDQLRKKLGPQYAGLLEVVQQNLPGFEVLEAHLCSVQGSPRKYVHFIARGRGTILSVILTRSEGEQLGIAFRSGASGSVNMYEAQLEGMNVAGFESKGYLGFVVSDLSQDTTMQIANELAPPLKAALRAGSRSEARVDLDAAPPVRYSG
jgi:anti-sigma factor (TIGR02949 family)